MGVTVLQQYPVGDRTTGPQAIETLTRRIVALGAVQTGHFLVDCETFVSIPQPQSQAPPQPQSQPQSQPQTQPQQQPQQQQQQQQHKTVHILHNSEQPASVFSVMDGGSKPIHIVADGLFDVLMMKLNNHYTSKKQTKMESKGPRFELGDFCVKLGMVGMNQTFKGVLVEVEYRPCAIPGAVWDLLREFMQGFLGNLAPQQPPPYLLNRLNEVYQPMDTIHQYLENFAAYRKAMNLRPV